MIWPKIWNIDGRVEQSAHNDTGKEYEMILVRLANSKYEISNEGLLLRYHMSKRAHG